MTVRHFARRVHITVQMVQGIQGVRRRGGQALGLRYAQEAYIVNGIYVQTELWMGEGGTSAGRGAAGLGP